MDLSVMRLSPRDWRCVYCHDNIQHAPLVCPECRTMLHRDCYEELGRCATYGCQGDLLAPIHSPEEPELKLNIGTRGILAAIALALALSGLIAAFLF